MKIEPIDGGRLRVWLSQTEAEQWNLHTDRPDPKTLRRAAGRLLRGVGRRPAGRLAAEMIPVEGGCVVLVSPVVHSRQPAVYGVPQEWLAEVSARWHPGWTDTAQVYAVGDDFHVVLYGDQAECLLREYGCPLGCGEAAAAHTAEYGVWVGEITAPVPAPPEREGPGR